MQTFLPVPNFKRSAQILDYQRLGKQRVEAYQILNILTGTNLNSRWKNHPIIKMWIGYNNALGYYMNCMIKEWIKRGYKNTMKLYDLSPFQDIKYPKWLGNNEFHASHRSNLLRKDRNYYSQFGWNEPDNLPYIWPGDL